MKLDQTIRNLTSGDLGFPLVVIRLGVTLLKKTRVEYLLDMFEGRGEKEQRDLVYVERLQMIGWNYLGSWSYLKEWVWNL